MSVRPQLSCGFKDLKLWWSLRQHGRRACAETIEPWWIREPNGQNR
jgi:hypothetical protein